MMKINLFPRTVCARSRLVLKDGAAYPVTHTLCACCAKVAKGEIAAFLRKEKKS